mgnify:CR=1 FL=1
MEQYEAWKALLRAGEATGWQEFYVKFYQAFIDGSRWKQYLNGVGTTLLVTAMALAIGIALGILVAMIRTAHDQQRAGKHNPVLGVLNGVCQVYVTVIRGTPMMVQLLIMGFVIFSSSRNYTMVGALTLGINSGAYVSEIIILLKDTSLITVIGGKELVYAAQAIYGRTYEQMFPLIGIACIYLLLVMIFSWLLSILERRLRQSDRR